MLEALIGLTLWGQATFYDPGVFEQVWSYRKATLPPCPECVGFAAMNRSGDLGRRIWVHNGQEWIGPLYVIDCASGSDMLQRQRQGRIVEVDHWLAERWGMHGPIPVLVADQPLPADNPCLEISRQRCELKE